MHRLFDKSIKSIHAVPQVAFAKDISFGASARQIQTFFIFL